MPKTAPSFELPDQDGNIRKLTDYAGQWLVVFFYPKDNSLNCTREVCAFRDEHSIIGQFGNAQVVGINKESVASHKKFSQKQQLNFPLLSDADQSVTKAYGAWRSNTPKLSDIIFSTRRNTYLIDPAGTIVRQYLTVNPENHVEQIIQDLQELQATAAA